MSFSLEHIFISVAISTQVASAPLNVKKATTQKNIPPKVLKASAMVTAEILQQLFNQALTTGEFPSNLKMQMLACI